MRFAELQKRPKNVPGVYMFRDARGKILYIGKATRLLDRVRSYFSKEVIRTRGERIVRMVFDARKLTWKETNSTLEALLLEAELIKKHQPEANVKERDNKSFNYIVITQEQFPRVLQVRGRELFQKWQKKDIGALFGPFPEGGALRDALKIVRKIFPYRDMCAPCVKENCPPCFNRQIGLCPGVCTGEVNVKEYKKSIIHLRLFLSGNTTRLLTETRRAMLRASKRRDFEGAGRMKKRLYALAHIRDVGLMKNERTSSGGERRERIESYDVAHTSGAETVGVMVVYEDGVPRKSEYRKFKLNSSRNNDVASLKEILERRLRHGEWQLPQCVLVDGGTAQIAAARNVLKKHKLSTPVVGVVKDSRHKAHSIKGDASFFKSEKLPFEINAETHRFAIDWHRARRRKGFLA